MHALRISRAHLSAVQFCSLVLCAVGVWVFITGAKKNGFESLPLVWYLVLTLGPLVALGCFVAMCRVRVGSAAWIAVGGVLVAPQLFVWYHAMSGVLHYLGWF